MTRAAALGEQLQHRPAVWQPIMSHFDDDYDYDSPDYFYSLLGVCITVRSSALARALSTPLLARGPITRLARTFAGHL